MWLKDVDEPRNLVKEYTGGVKMDRIEFEQSFVMKIKDYYKKNNVSFKQGDAENFHAFLIDYFEVLRKGIISHKRKVYISRELKLKSKSSDFREWKNRLDKLIIMFENGEDMTPFLSKQAMVSGFKDRMLTCWDMHHLHFYPQKKSGDMLLFAMVKENEVYMIDVLPHSKKYVFSTFHLLNIVHDNWRFVLEPYRIKGATGLSYVIKTDEEVNALRKAGVSTAIQLGRDIYALDMMSTDGHSSLDVIYANQICNSVRLNEKNGIFSRYKLLDLSLTNKMRPSFVLTYLNETKDIAVWAM